MSFARPIPSTAVEDPAVRGQGPPFDAASGHRERLVVGLIAVVAALPSLVSAASGGFVADDWGFLLGAEQGSSTWWLEGLDARFRPVQAAIHGLMFELFGSSAAASLVTMALLEVVAALMLRRLVARFAPLGAADAAALVWAALPNRSAPRLWISAAPVTVCVLLLLGAALAATGERRRPVVATALACAAVLTYEAGVLVGLLVVVWAWFDPVLPRPDVVARIARPVVVYGVVVVWNLMTSPKSSSAPAASTSAFDALAGAGLVPHGLGAAGTAAGLLVLGSAIAGTWVDRPLRPVVHLGALVALAGLAPLLLVGASPTLSGPVDRLNVIPMLGLAVVLGVGLHAIATRLRRPVVAVAVAGLTATVAVAHADDLRAVDAARRDAERAVEAFADLPPQLTDDRLVLDPGAGHRGWYAFGWGSARAAIRLRTGLDLELRDPPAGHLDARSDETVVRIDSERGVVAR